MSKQTQYFMTNGVASMPKPINQELMVEVSKKFHSDNDYFLSFHPNGNQTIVTDGNDNVFTTLDIQVPEVMFFIRDEHEEFYVATLMFANEY